MKRFGFSKLGKIYELKYEKDDNVINFVVQWFNISGNFEIANISWFWECKVLRYVLNDNRAAVSFGFDILLHLQDS